MASPPSPPVPAPFRVAIVGAGVAGLAAARELLVSKRLRPEELIVLEASERIGGRVHSISFGTQTSVTIDAGAAWIHGASNRNAFVRDVVVPANIRFTPISDRNPWLHPASCTDFQLCDGRAVLTEDETQYAWRINETLLRTLQQYATTEQLSQQYSDWSVQQIVDAIVRDGDATCGLASELRELVVRHERGHALLRLCLSLIEVWMGTSSEMLQLEDFKEIDLIGDDPGPHALVPHGMEQAVHYLASSIPEGVIRTNTPVELVEYAAADGVTLHLAGGSQRILADHVIVTCSIGVLKAGAIRFSPQLPEAKRAVIERSDMGHYMKILLEFPHVFWSETKHFFGDIAACDPHTNRDGGMANDRFRFPLVLSYVGAKGAPLLEAVLFGNDALEASELADDVLVTAFVKSLKGMFGDDIPAPLTHFVSRWNKNPWIRGAYSYLTLDSTTQDPEILRQTVAGRVLFAGEATTMQYQGSVQGAFVTGLAAVKELDTVATCLIDHL